MKKLQFAAAIVTGMAMIPSAGWATNKLICWPGWQGEDVHQDVSGDPSLEQLYRHSRDTLNLVDGSGRATVTLERRLKLLSKDSLAVKTPWVSVESARIFTSTGELANDFGKLGPDGNGYCDTRIFATYDSGGGAETFLVYTAGHAVYDWVNDLDVSRIRVWVFDVNGNLQKTIKVEGNGIPGWQLTGGLLRVGDFDGDGSDDLMVARQLDDPLGGPLVELRTKVFDLLTGTLKYKIEGTGYVSYTNLNSMP